MGICRKSGSLLPGHDIAFDSVRSGKAKLIILTSDASRRHEKELEAVHFGGKTLRLTLSAEEVQQATGKKSCIYSVTDRGFAQAIEKKIREEGIQHDKLPLHPQPAPA